MNIRESLSNAYVSAARFAGNVGSTVRSYGSLAVEKGRLGVNHTVELVRNNPKAAAASAVALLAVAGFSAIMYSAEGVVPPAGPTSTPGANP